MLRDRIMMGATISSLPLGYTKIEYLESNGSQFIDTGFVPNQDTRVKMSILASGLSGETYAYGARNSAGSNAFLCALEPTAITFGYAIQYRAYEGVIDGRYDIDQNKNIITVNGTEISGNYVESFSSESNLTLFGRNTAGSVEKLSAIKLYSCQIYDNGVLARDYVPCSNPIGVKGLWDKVNEEFYALTPTGYTRLAYLESNGSDYIDTDFKATYQTRVVLDISDLTSVDTHIFGAKKADSGTASDQFSMIRRTSTTIRSDYFGTNASADMADTITRFTIDKDANVTKINGVVAITNTAVSSGASQYNMYLFGCNTANDSSKIYPSSYKLYSCKIYDNGVLVRDFIPCTNPDGISGLWDSVNDVFYKLLPADYTKLDFIETDGTTYIDTGFKPNQDTRVVMDFEPLVTTTSNVFGSRTAYKSSDYTFWIYESQWLTNYSGQSTIIANPPVIGRILVDKNKNVTTVNGVVTTNNPAVFQSPVAMTLCAANENGTLDERVSQIRIYSCQIYDNGTLVRDFIPAMNASGEAGLYDLKNDVWYALLPVVKQKVENKISIYTTGNMSNRNYGFKFQFPTASKITIDYEGSEMMGSSGGRYYVRFATIAAGVTKTGTIEYTEGSGSITDGTLEIYGRNITAITSISPTEDDTYIYTF